MIRSYSITVEDSNTIATYHKHIKKTVQNLLQLIQNR